MMESQHSLGRTRGQTRSEQVLGRTPDVPTPDVPTTKKVGRPRKRQRLAGGRINKKTKEASNNESSIAETCDVSQLYCKPVGIPLTTRSANRTHIDVPEQIQIQNVLPTETDVDVDVEVDERNDYSNASGICDNIILTASKLSGFIEDNFCSKEYVSHGMVALLNQFTIYVSNEIKNTVTKITSCDERHPRLRKEYIENILATELDVNSWKDSFVRKKVNQSQQINQSINVSKRLGQDYIDPVKVRFESYGLATNVYVDIFANLYQRHTNKIKKTITMLAPHVHTSSTLSIDS